MVSALRSAGVPAIGSKCSTPYGINGFGTIRSARYCCLLPQCSTPYGINGFGTSDLDSSKLVQWPVLNALRHQWFRHTEAGSRIAGCWCAQRLTASMVSARLYEQKFRLGGRSCSTPYGINGFGTKTQPIQRVLSNCAQRLTASMVSAHKV